MLLLGGAIAVILIFGMTQFDAQTLWLQMRQFSVGAIALSLGAVLLQIFCQTARLWFLFPKSVGLTWKRAAIAFIRGQFVGNWVSTQAGYAVKIWYVRPKVDRQRLSLLSATAIIFLDKIVDISILVMLSIAGTLWFFQAQSQVSHPSMIAMKNHIAWLWQQVVANPAQTTFIICGLMVGAYCFKKLWIKKLKSSTLIHTIRKQLQLSLAFVTSPTQTWGAAMMGLGDWIFEILSLQILCSAQNFNLNFAQLTICLLILNIGISLPSGIANVGAFEASLTFGLMQFGLPLEQSLGIAVIYHLLQLLGITLWYVLVSLGNNEPQADPVLVSSHKKVK